MPKMRAKMRLNSVAENDGYGQTLFFSAVYKKDGYPEDGSDENNSFARWTPQAELKMVVNNPELFGQFTQGQEFYLDFTLATA